MRKTVSRKKPSGTMLMSISVEGSSIHKSFLKNIWWNIIKYLVKSVEIMSAVAADRKKKIPVPAHTARGKVLLKLVFNKRRTIRHKAMTMRQPDRMDRAPKNSPRTSSIWAISRALKNSRSTLLWWSLREDCPSSPADKTSSHW